MSQGSRQEENLNRIDLLFLSEHEELRLFLGKIWEVYVAKGDAKGATPNLERVKEVKTTVPAGESSRLRSMSQVGRGTSTTAL